MPPRTLAQYLCTGVHQTPRLATRAEQFRPPAPVPCSSLIRSIRATVAAGDDDDDDMDDDDDDDDDGRSTLEDLSRAKKMVHIRGFIERPKSST